MGKGTDMEDQLLLALTNAEVSHERTLRQQTKHRLNHRN